VDLEKIKELVQLMVENDLVEIALRDGTEEVNLKRPTASDAVVAGACPLPGMPLPAAALPAETGAPPREVEQAPPPAVDEGLQTIRSPMVGTFYASSAPDAAPYVTVGSVVTADSVVCIVEAMKVFNEIKAEVAGTIEKILVTNEAPIEYGQELFLVRSA